MNLRRCLLVAAIAVDALSAAACSRGGQRAAPPPLATPSREVRMSEDVSLAGVVWFIDIYESVGDRTATGAMRITTGEVNRGHIAHDFGCRSRPTREEGQWECVVPFRHGTPNWAGILAKLDSLGIMAPPHNTARVIQKGMLGQLICMDGAPWKVEVLVDGKVAVSDAQVCGPIDARRARYEAGVDSVFGIVARVAGGPKG